MNQSKSHTWWGALVTAIAVGVGASAGAAEPGVSEWVRPGADGSLVYRTTPAGDRIMDVSYAGYMGGGVALPTVAVKRTVTPSGGEDDTKPIQAAIDEVARMPLENGLRGAVLLGPGVFTCPQTITISASGVVLRGSGSGTKEGTTIRLVGKPHVAISARGPGGSGRQGAGDERGATRTSIADAYVQ